MIPRHRLLAGLWNRTHQQKTLNSWANCLVERGSPLSADTTSGLPEDEIATDIEITHLSGLEGRQIDHIKKAINNATTTNRILQVIERHAFVMTEVHLLTSVQRLFHMVAQGTPVESIRKHQAFQIWMDAVCLRIGECSGTEQYWLLSYMTKLEVEPRAEVIEKLITSLRLKLNQLKLTQLLSLQSQLLRLQTSSPSIDVLKKTIPAVVQARIGEEFENDDVELCYRALNFVFLNEMDFRSRNLVARAALRHCRIFSRLQAYRTLLSSSWVPRSDAKADPASQKLREVLAVCLDIVATQMEHFSDDDLKRLLKIPGSWNIGSGRFMAGLWKRAFKWSLRETSDVLSASITVDHMTLPLADQIVGWYLENHCVFNSLEAARYYVPPLATVIATSVVHNDEGTGAHQRARRAMEILLEFIIEGNTGIQNEPFPLSYILCQVCAAGLFPRPLLDKAFSESFQEQLSIASYSIGNLAHLEELVASEIKDSPNYTVETQYRVNNLRFIDITRRKVLSHVAIKLGGNQFARKEVKFTGRSVNIVVAVGKNGLPVEIPGEVRQAAHFEKLPADTKVVAIVFGERTHFSSGLPRPWCARKIQWLKAENLCPLVIDVLDLKRMSSEDWGMLFMDRFKEALRLGCVYSKPQASEIILDNY